MKRGKTIWRAYRSFDPNVTQIHAQAGMRSVEVSVKPGVSRQDLLVVIQHMAGQLNEMRVLIQP
jgi:hypothetical protein